MGTENLIPGIKKRQRAILLRLNQERDEIKRLKESHKIASQERKLMLQQQHHIAKMKLAAKEIANKLYSKDLSPKVRNSRNSVHIVYFCFNKIYNKYVFN
jgi:hypothetical protein